MIDSLANSSALDIAKQLPEPAYFNLLALQKSLSLGEAATAKTVAQVMHNQGEQTTAKLVCAILKLFNDGLNTSLQMTSKQLFEYSVIWCEAYPNETIKDLILCLKRVKAGRYGPIFNRIDGTVVSDFFRQYLLEKADWGEQENRKFISDQIKAGNGLLDILTKEQREKLKKLTTRPAVNLPTDAVVASDKSYTEWLKQHAEDVEFEVLENVQKRAKSQNIEEVVVIVETEISRRLKQFDSPKDTP